MQTFHLSTLHCNERLDNLEKIFACDTFEKLTEALCAIADAQGFSSVLFGSKASKAIRYDAALIATNYAPAWRETYEKNALHLIDPTVNHSLSRLQPLTWNRSTFATDVEHAFYEEASRFGLKSGITFPIHGAHGEFGLISFASDEELTQSDLLTAMMPLAWIRDFVFEASLRVMLADVHASQRSPLTPRETECLKWLAAGKTSWETSRILMCSEATVNFHVSNIVRKLDVSSRQQAVFKSVREGWVPLG